MTGYMGHRSRAAWNVALWIVNDEGVYRELLALVERAEKLAGDVEAAPSTTRALGGPTAVQAALCDFRLKAGKEA